MNQKSYLQERSQRLHFEILDELDNKASVEKKASELLTLLEEHCARDYSSILEKHGRQKLQNEVLTSPLSSIGLDLAPLSGDGIFLYQIFTLLNNESCRKKAEALAKKEYENMISCYKYILEGFPGGGDEIEARLNKAEYLYSADIKDCALDDLSPYFEEGGFKQTIYPRKALFDYCFLSTKEYDDKLDREIIDIFKAHLSCNRDPRDLFHTDHTYIKDHLAKEIEGRVEAESLFKSVRLRYILRDIYPKPSFGGMEKSNYNVQRILFDRVLFNEVALDLRPPSTPYPKYWEPEMLLDFYLHNIIPSRALVKSEWIGLYLASKEIELDRFQHLFRTIGPRERDYKKSALDTFYAHTFERIELEENLKGDFKKELISVDRNLNNAPPSLGRAQKSLFKGLLFICMWEKSSYIPISQKFLDELSNGDYASPEEGVKALCDYGNKTELHSLFTDSPIENLCPVLKEASKLLKMSEEGFDYNYYSLEGDTGGAEDFITLLHSYSRIERESKPALISVLNLLRERQLQYLPIIKNNKVDEANLKKIQEIDRGFKLDYFQSTLYPLYELRSLQKSDLNNQYIYSSKTVKFICESDRVYMKTGKDVDWLPSNRRALHTIYLYKIRNQASHFAEDENIPVSMEPKHLSNLIPTLIEGFRTSEKYAKDIYSGWEREGLAKRMLASRPFRLIPSLYLRNHLCLLIKVLCLIAEEKGHPEIASLAMGEGFDKLEAYLKNQDKPTEFSSYKLTEEERSSILKKIALVESFCSLSFRAQDKPFDLAEHYLTYPEEILRDTLRFLFSSEVQNYYERTQENSFLKTHHAESTFYMLYLAPALFNNPNITQNKE